MQAPRLLKITLNMGVGEAKQDSKMLEAAQEQLATIAGQKPNIRRAKQVGRERSSCARACPSGLTVTLRGERAYEFLDRLTSIAIPRIRDFRGLNPRSFDGRGNYSMGVREQVIFPEIDYDSVDQVRGLDVTLTTSAETDAEAFALLDALGMPFARDGRPRRLREPQHRARHRLETKEPWPRPPRSRAQQRPPKYKTRAYTRCRQCGRPRAVYRKFGLCRICLRELAHNGYIPGMTKSSW